MKKVITILMFSFWLCVVAIAQDYDVSPNPASVEGVASGFPLIAYAEMVNNTYESQTVVWKRTVEDLPEGWTSNVCTSQGCALADVSEGIFTMIPLEELNVDIQFNSESIVGSGMVKLELYFESDTSNVTTVVYHGDALVSGLLDSETAELEIYPNPVENFFEIKGAENVHQIKIFNILGNQSLKTRDLQNKIFVNHLPTGTYQVLFYDEEETLMRTIPLFIF